MSEQVERPTVKEDSTLALQARVRELEAENATLRWEVRRLIELAPDAEPPPGAAPCEPRDGDLEAYWRDREFAAYQRGKSDTLDLAMRSFRASLTPPSDS
jgi:hypothetical protein